ncbi:MAG: hypothetical protein NT070_18580 [Cyanobacteria bacterium]|nr:hypothetical protein [Cyanobacteriota bacterium]
MLKILSIALLFTLIPSQVLAWSIDYKTSTIFTDGQTPGQSYEVIYQNLSKSKKIRADQCGVLKIEPQVIKKAKVPVNLPIRVGANNITVRNSSSQQKF